MIKLYKCLLLIVTLFIFASKVSAQNIPAWDNTMHLIWPSDCKKINIPSTLDGKDQPAYFYRAKSAVPRPLIVSLHTWSGGYEQKDTLSWMCIDKDYNYIHPNFRGPNNNPEACGSKYALQDIEDAITYAIEHSNVDSSQIHVIGTSGGGYATLLSYMITKHPVKTFSAWVPISDLQKWYYESEGRGTKYALDIARSTVPGAEFTEDFYFLGKEEAIKRSPYFMKTPIGQRGQSKLYIYAGIHDGYTGSVPITQSLNFYNKMIRDYDPSNDAELISDTDIIELVSSRNFRKKSNEKIGSRTIHYQRSYKDQIRIRIFEGSHEMLPEAALNHIESKRILTIGDSNGAAREGWVNQLKQIRFDDQVFNESVSGNTIGFNNLNSPALNTLSQINEYLGNARKYLHRIDDIIIMLGTNDCKSVFTDSLELIPQKLDALIKKIKRHPAFLSGNPQIYIVSPPPIGQDEIMFRKYHGGASRMAWLFPKIKEVAEKNNCAFVDVYHKLLPNWNYYSEDGIHVIKEGQRIIASSINDALLIN